MTSVLDDRSRRISWGRLTAEAAAIVVSILLAFAIQAWWEGVNAAREEIRILTGLRTDFESSLHEATRVRLASEENRSATQRLLAAAGPLPNRATAESQVDSLLASLMFTEVYRPTDATLSSLVNAQGLGMLSNAELREKLTEWNTVVVAGVQRALNERDAVFADHLAPYLRTRIPVRSLDPILEPFYGPGPSQFPIETQDLLTDVEFENLIADIYFLSNQAVISLEQAEAAATGILALIEGELAADS